jgi:NTE family protein
MTQPMKRALVLSGGGPVGVGWETGIIAGLNAQGVDLRRADFVVGTSAGSVVGAHLAAGEEASAVIARANSNRADGGRRYVGATPEQMQAVMQAFMELFTSTEPDEVKRAKIGRFALTAQTMSEEEFLAVFGQLAEAPWPAGYACTAVDAETGDFVVWDEAASVPLVRAVASSCAVPGVFPPITIKGRRYIDGGVRSASNADLAKGAERVLIVSLLNPETMTGPASPFADGYRREIATLEQAGARIEAVYPDAEAAAVMGINVMDPSLVLPAIATGERQGKTIADGLRDFWGA